ncbi:DUF1652 domain-containing protein [Pseudomonas akapageensis]|uniref:DUF1652 domain-containing protein n=1 Tax=Pseudomonas akapageensis TaxID=2609961 RepID=UPI00140C6B44|nr:DUF1652 domain-containing protein [Pseudomonas akapageensis]
MMTLGLCPLELRNIIECEFLPLQCTCTCAPDQTLTVHITDPATHCDLVVPGISMDRLSSSKEISRLVDELRAKLECKQHSLAHPIAG